MSFFSFLSSLYKIREQEGETGSAGGDWYQWEGGRRWWNGEGG
jgi:hypothetical protein